MGASSTLEATLPEKGTHVCLDRCAQQTFEVEQTADAEDGQPPQCRGASPPVADLTRFYSLDVDHPGQAWRRNKRAVPARASGARQSRVSAVRFSATVEVAEVRNPLRSTDQRSAHRGTVGDSDDGSAPDCASEPCASETVQRLLAKARAAAKADEVSIAIQHYQEALAAAPGDERIQKLLSTAIQHRANPYVWLPSWLSCGDTAEGRVKPNVRDPYHFQNPREYREFNPEDIDAGFLGYARLLKRCVYEFVDDNRFVKVLAALILICIYDCAIPVVMQLLFDHWIPCKDTEKIQLMLVAFAVLLPVYVYAHTWVISKPLDQIYVRNRLFRHALRMPWAFWNFESAGQHHGQGKISTDGSTTHDAMVTSLITEDFNVVIDATCTAFDVFKTLLRLTFTCITLSTQLELSLTIAIPPFTVHLFTFVVIEYLSPRFLYHTNRRQLEYERCIKEVQESVRGAHALQLFKGESHSTQRMLRRLTDFDTHHFAAVKLRWQIEQLPDIIAQLLRFCTLCWGPLLVLHEDMTVGSLFALLTVLTGLGGDATALARHTMSLTRARPSLQRIYRFLDHAEVNEPAPQSLLGRKSHQPWRERSRTELLLARIDADPVVRISECSFSYGTWLLSKRGAKTFDTETAARDSSQQYTHRGYLRMFYAMVASLVALMTATATLDPVDLENGGEVREACSDESSELFQALTATVGECLHATPILAYNFTHWKDREMKDFTGCIRRMPSPEGPSIHDLTTIGYLVIATYVCTILLLTCGFAYFVKDLSGLQWYQVIHCPCCSRRQEQTTSLRKSLANHDKQIVLDTDFIGDLRTSSTNYNRFSSRGSRGSVATHRIRRLRMSASAASGRQSRQTTRSSTEVEQEPPILQGLSMSIPRGELVVLCGEAAFGKTTMFRLLTKTNEPETGRIHVHLVTGGVVAGVEQETFIFDASIFENIRMGHPSASKSMVQSAAKAAGIHAKRDLQMPCGVGGKLLSPAEAQRIGIARGCLRIATAPDPSDSLLVLDDPFSFQDPHSTESITSHLRHLVSRGTSVVVLTQHSQLCAAADTVFLLEDGRLKASGTHEDMLQEQSRYSRIHSISESFSISSNGSVTRVRGSGLENYWIFAGLDSAERSAVAKAFEPQHFQAGQVVYEVLGEGQGHSDQAACHQLCIVTRGQVELVVGEADQQAAVAVYGVGQIFGPAVSLMNLDQYAQVRCSKPTDVVALDATSLEHFCEEFGTLQTALDTCRELRSEFDTNQHLRQLWRGFQTLSEEELEDVRSLLATEVYPIGMQICRQAQEVDKLLLIVRGEVELDYGGSHESAR